MIRGWFAAGAASVTLAFAACGVSLSGDPSAADAGAPPPTDDAPSDSVDAGSDASEAGTFCSTVTGAKYCEDFDRETDVAKIIVPELGPDDAGVPRPALTSETYQSAPRSLWFGLPVGFDGFAFAVYKVPKFDPAATARVELDMKIDADPGAGSLQSVTWKRGGPQFSIGRTCAPNPDSDGGIECGWFVLRCFVDVDKQCDAPVPWPDPPFVGRWARVYLEARLSTNGHFAAGVVGGKSVYVANIAGYRDDLDPSQDTVLTIGIANTQGVVVPTSLFVDDVVATETPP